MNLQKSDDLTLNTPGVIKLRLMGKEYKVSITEFNVAFGLITAKYATTQDYKLISYVFMMVLNL